MTESDPRILIVSDTHLGALNSNLDEVSLFLNKIIDGKFGDNLQALLILGDFLDLGTTVEKTFYTDKKITNIFAQLLEIKKKIHIIFVPGNHEIPVTSSVTSGNYDEKFKRRKEKFLKKFMNSMVEELFDSNMVCQYILLRKWENESTLLLYDSQDQIYNHPIQTIKINNLDLEENYKCLMLHGYQFESDTMRIFVAPFWKSMLSYQNIEIKEVYNYFWNVVIKEQRKIKPITIEDMKSDLIGLKQLSSEDIDAIFSDLSNLEFNLIKLNMKVMKIWRNTRDSSYYFDGIEEFFEEVECDLSLITHLIYGHSHIMGMSNETINNQNIEITNSGTWQHSNPSYVEILYKGKIILKSLNL
ncbi:MAG: metallophosphoesterase [Candidatus Lokiarchaeota archaeon]|nr:metallophosphoesterase [Candidatus Lokiarchaeota archaeon]